MQVKTVTDKNFDEVLQHEGTVLLDFWAGWCGPCRMMAPVVEEIANERPDVFVGKVDVDAESGLAQKFNIYSIPTFIVLKNGEVTAQTAGARPKAALEELL